MATRENDITKKAEVIQQYFNKIGITKIKDLTIPKDQDSRSIYAIDAYRTSPENLTIVDQGRLQRYREFEQMCYVPELNGGLELYSDDGSLYNEDDEVIGAQSDDQNIKDTLHDLWFKALDMNSVLWHVFYNTCKYGDAFYEIVPDNYKNPKKIKYLKFVPPNFVVRVEENGNLLEFVVKISPDSRTPTSATFYSSQEAEEFHLKPWQMVHFKLDDKEFEPYGKSVLEHGRLTFKQMKLIEDAMLIYRISRAPERRIFKIPVGNLPYREAMKRVDEIKARFRKTPWIDPITGDISYKANPLCIALDTKIDLLDGRSVELKDLIKEYKAGKENWTYSIDRENGNKVVPGEIEWAGITRKDADLVEVYIDNGKSIRCTPDHKFMLRDGSYKEARDLLVGESFMPKYTKTSKKGYELVYNPKTRKYIPTYMVVAREEHTKDWNRRWTKRTIHHVDFNKSNNDPKNLLIIENKDHVKLHGDLSKKNWQIPEYREKQIVSRKRAWADASDERRQKQSDLMAQYNKSDKHRKATTKRNNKFWADPILKEKTSQNMRKPKSTTEKMKINFDEKFWEFINEEILSNNHQADVVRALNCNIKFLTHFETCTPRNKNQVHRHMLGKAYRIKGFDNFKEYSEFIKNGENHKVSKVVWLSEKEDTGCITVKRYHNFATNEVVVRNSINDDFYVPIRQDGTGIQIDYEPGGQLLNEIKDVEYFKDKILRTMRIPIAYLTGEMTGDVARTSLSAMDVRFAKTIERIQKQIIKGLEKIAIVELAFKRFTIEDMHGFKIDLTAPSKIYEIQELETFTNKLSTISTAMALADESGSMFLPKEWLYKKILKLTDQEISNIKLMQQREAAEKVEATAAAEAGTTGAEEFGGGMTPGVGGIEMGGPEAGAPGGEIEVRAGEGGLEAGPPPDEIAAEKGGGAELAASQIMKIAGQNFLVENEEDIMDLIKFIKEHRETEKITKDKFIKSKKKLYENNFDQLFIHGELKGLIRRKNNKEVLNS